jgi:hypothetical protein
MRILERSPASGGPVADDRADDALRGLSTPSGTSTGRWILALASFAAAAVHFAVVGDHAQETLAIGLAFAAVAWAQTLSGVAILVSTDRRWFVATLALNLGVIAIWAVSRTFGLPTADPPWTAEALGRADVLATVLEVGIVAGCLLLLAGRRVGPAVGDRGRRNGLVAYGAALALLTSATITTMGEHTHAGAVDGHDHGATRAEGEFVGGPSDTEHGGPRHLHVTGATHEHTDGHAGGPPAGVADAAQLEQIRAAMERYADVDAALAEGFERMDDDYPGTGAHFGIPEWTEGGAYSITGDLDLANPEYLMYSKRLTGSWKLVAVAYVADLWDYPEPPTALQGAPYHEHVWNCIESEGWTLDEEDWGVISKEECEIMGNIWSPGGEWMAHVWLIPNPSGVFADENPTLA